MRKVLSDYDGIMIETEFSKALGWYVACLALKGGDKWIDQKLVGGISSKEWFAKERLDLLKNERKDDLAIAKSFAGGTTYDFVERMWQKFYVGEVREPNEEEKKFINGTLIPEREKIRDPIIDWFAQPLEGNLKFFKALYEVMRETYHDEHPIGLVNQSTSKGLNKQFALKRNGESVWSEFPEFPRIFGEHSSDRGFPYAECAGDKRIAYRGVDKTKIKKVAYDILCGKIKVNPLETISFEDTKDGACAARDAGIGCIGVKEKNDGKTLEGANYTIFGSLEQIIEFIPTIVRGTPAEAFIAIKIGLENKKIA